MVSQSRVLSATKRWDKKRWSAGPRQLCRTERKTARAHLCRHPAHTHHGLLQPRNIRAQATLRCLSKPAATWGSASRKHLYTPEARKRAHLCPGLRNSEENWLKGLRNSFAALHSVTSQQSHRPQRGVRQVKCSEH